MKSEFSFKKMEKQKITKCLSNDVQNFIVKRFYINARWDQRNSRWWIK